jgi:hypothetical protein
LSTPWKHVEGMGGLSPLIPNLGQPHAPAALPTGKEPPLPIE